MLALMRALEVGEALGQDGFGVLHQSEDVRGKVVAEVNCQRVDETRDVFRTTPKHAVPFFERRIGEFLCLVAHFFGGS